MPQKGNPLVFAEGRKITGTHDDQQVFEDRVPTAGTAYLRLKYRLPNMAIWS